MASTATPTTACRAPSATPADAAGHPLVLQPEGSLDQPTRCCTGTRRAGATGTTDIDPRRSPSVKWLEPRHMVNYREPLGRDKTDDLQYAFFNGVGYESWENIWGIWNQIHAARRRSAAPHRHDRAQVRRHADQPGLGAVHSDAAARRLRQHVSRGRRTLWTFVNRNEYDGRRASRSRVHARRARAISTCGTAWRSTARDRTTARPCCDFAMEAHGYGARAGAGRAARAVDGLDDFLATMHELAEKPLATLLARMEARCRSKSCAIAPTQALRSEPRPRA